MPELLWNRTVKLTASATAKGAPMVEFVTPGWQSLANATDRARLRKFAKLLLALCDEAELHRGRPQ